ncbi:hypothetical protein IWZ03DRAFT_156004 [Phyllosticta citriasiana]|uniref:Uncharacterized protein n=1 Tax=Phyllosticta citriasiana TaxID=595635 RepID=A0ABR1KPB6_9PEZI
MPVSTAPTTMAVMTSKTAQMRMAQKTGSMQPQKRTGGRLDRLSCPCSPLSACPESKRCCCLSFRSYSMGESGDAKYAESGLATGAMVCSRGERGRPNGFISGCVLLCGELGVLFVHSIVIYTRIVLTMPGLVEMAAYRSQLSFESFSRRSFRGILFACSKEGH